MATHEDAILAVAGALSEATVRYAANEISAAEFVAELTGFMSDDIVFWSSYTPSWEPLRPLFAERRGIDEIVARYDYENEHEVIEHGSGVPIGALTSSLTGDRRNERGCADRLASRMGALSSRAGDRRGVAVQWQSAGALQIVHQFPYFDGFILD